MVWKHIAVIVVALLIGFATYFALSPLFGYVIEQEYMTDAKEQERVEVALESFKAYVEENQISSTDMEAVIVPIGGGGLISGIAFTLKTLNPNIKVYGVQSAGAPSMYNAIKEGKIQALASVSTIADGIAVKKSGDLTY